MTDCGGCGGCTNCRLAAKNPRYASLFERLRREGVAAAAAPVRAAECVHLGELLKRAPCGQCRGKDEYACDRHGRCTRGDLARADVPCCRACPDYDAG